MNETGDKIITRSQKPMSDNDIKKCLGSDAKILEYSELSKFTSIQELLPKKRDFVVLLVGVESSEDGHWEALIRVKKRILFFDAYGYRVDKQLKWAPESVRSEMNQDIPHLTLLLNKAVDDGFKVTFNEYPFQDRDDLRYATCGRWCAMVILYYMETPKPTLKKFHKLVMSHCKKYELVPDLLVSKVITE